MQAIKLLLLTSLWVSIDIVKACSPSSSRKTCCDDIEDGFCFKSGVFPVDPMCPEIYAPTFTLYTRNSTEEGVSLSRSKIPLEFSNNRRTAFIVHGWTERFHSTYKRLMSELLAKEDMNVIAVDWGCGATALNYIPSAANTQSIGALIGAVTNTLREQPGSSPYFWCIGLSLGAHVCGFSSLTAKPLLDRITGLDPAGPGFSRDMGLTRESASNVDIIHTDKLFGSSYPRGHVDFYPNGGVNQPDCPMLTFEKDPDSMTEEERVEFIARALTGNLTVFCSHVKSLVYMIQSVRDTSCFVANQVCSDFKDIPKSCTKIPTKEPHGTMGYDATNNRYHGYLYFEANSSIPYCSIIV